MVSRPIHHGLRRENPALVRAGRGGILLTDRIVRGRPLPLSAMNVLPSPSPRNVRVGRGGPNF